MTEQETGPYWSVTRRRALAGIATTSALGGLSSGVSAAGRPEHANVSTTVLGRQVEDGFEYTVKFLCGIADGDAVAPGEYRTAINVHNPTDEGIQFDWKVALAGPAQAGPVSEFVGFDLGPDEAIEVDCGQVRELAGIDERFLKGFVVIRSESELDVVAVYTAAGEDGTVSTLDVQDVEPTAPPPDGMPDLVPADVDCEGFVVTVTNRGTAPAGPSETVIDFGEYATRTAETPALDPGESESHGFSPERGCFDSDCEFTVTVDAGDDVDESDEDNNVLDGTCIG